MSSITTSTTSFTRCAFEALRGKSLLIFDDGMTSKDGHWFEYNRAVAEAHRDLGVRTTIICHESFKEISEFEAVGAEVLRLVARSGWVGDHAKTDGLISELSHVVSLGTHFADILSAQLKNRYFDCVFLPNARVYDAYALCLLSTRGYKRQWSRLAPLFRFNLGRIVDGGSPEFARKLKIWKYLLAFIERANRGKLALLTDSSRLASEYHAVAGVDLKVMPSPRTMKPISGSVPVAPDLLFATLGHARLEKGVDIFQNAIRKLLDSDRAGGMRFLIQWNRAVPTADGQIYSRDPGLVGSDRVEFIDTVLSSEEYEQIFNRIGCMVLPYRRSMYHSRISGIAVEAACAGTPIIYTDDTWLSDFVAQQGAGVGVPDGDADALASAMISISNNRAKFITQARSHAKVALRLNSVDAFVDGLWGLNNAASDTVVDR